MESLGSSVFKCSFFGAPFVAITDYEGIQCFFDPRLVRGFLSLMDIDFEKNKCNRSPLIQLLSADHTVLKKPKVYFQYERLPLSSINKQILPVFSADPVDS